MVFNTLKLITNVSLAVIVIIGFPVYAFFAFIESNNAKEWKENIKDFYSDAFKVIFS